MKTFILVVTFFMMTGGTIQYRIEPANFAKIEDCLKQAGESQTWFKTVLEKAGLKFSSAANECIAK